MKAKKKDLKKRQEKRDALGYTFEDYVAFQELADASDKRGDELLDGWDITAEQIKLINAPESPMHGVAVLCFYDVNKIRLYGLAGAYMRYNSHLMTVIDTEDLVQQLYCDLLCGYLKLPYETKQITKTIIGKCFVYAAVGGSEGIA